jgi:hypothetical protein
MTNKSDWYNLPTQELESILDGLRIQGKDYQQQLLLKKYDMEYTQNEALLIDTNNKIRFVRGILSLRRKPKVVKY